MRTIAVNIDPTGARTGAQRVVKSLEDIRKAGSKLGKETASAMNAATKAIRDQSSASSSAVDAARSVAAASSQASEAVRQHATSNSRLREEFGRYSGSSRKVTRANAAVKRSFLDVDRAIQLVATSLTIRRLVGYADGWTNVQNQLRLVTSGSQELRRVTDQLFQSAQNNRAAFDATATLYAGLARSTGELGLSQQQLLTITNAVSQSMQISGSDAQAASGAIRQLSQAFASGVLRGDEFNSVNEAAPRLMTALATSIGVTRGELRAMAADGQLTSDVLANALLTQAPLLASEFGQMSVTVGQALTQLDNSLGRLVGSMSATTGASELVATAISALATNIEEVAAVAIGLGAALAVSAFGPSVVGAIGTVTVALRGATGAMAALNVAVRANPFGLAAAAIGTLVTGVALFMSSTSEAAEAQRELNELQESALSTVDQLESATRSNAAARLEDATATREQIQAEIELAQERQRALLSEAGLSSSTSPEDILGARINQRGRAQIGGRQFSTRQLAELREAATELQNLQQRSAEVNEAIAQTEERFGTLGVASEELRISIGGGATVMDDMREQLLLLRTETALVVDGNEQAIEVFRDEQEAIALAERAVADHNRARKEQIAAGKEAAATLDDFLPLARQVVEAEGQLADANDAASEATKASTAAIKDNNAAKEAAEEATRKAAQASRAYISDLQEEATAARNAAAATRNQTEINRLMELGTHEARLAIIDLKEEQALAAIEAEIHAQNVALLDEQLSETAEGAIRDYIAALEDQKAAMEESFEQDRVVEFADENERQAQRVQDAWSNTTSAIGSLFDDLFGDLFDGLGRFGGLAEGILTDILGQATGSSAGSLGGIVGDLVSDGLVSSVTSAGSSMLGGSSGSGILGNLGSIFGGGGSGGGISSMLGSVGGTINNFVSSIVGPGGQLFNAGGMATNFATSGLGQALGLSTGAVSTTPAMSVGGAMGELFAGGGGLTQMGTQFAAGVSQLGSIAVAPFLGMMASGIIGALMKPDPPRSAASFGAQDGRAIVTGVVTENDGDEAIGREMGNAATGILNAALDSMQATLLDNAQLGMLGMANKAFVSTIEGGAFQRLDSTLGIDALPADQRRFAQDEDGGRAAIADFVARTLVRQAQDGSLDGLADGASETIRIGMGNIARNIEWRGLSEEAFEDVIADINFVAAFDRLAESLDDVAVSGLGAQDRLNKAAESQRAFNESLDQYRSEAQAAVAETGATPFAGLGEFIDRAERLFDPSGGNRFQIRNAIGGGRVDTRFTYLEQLSDEGMQGFFLNDFVGSATFGENGELIAGDNEGLRNNNVLMVLEERIEMIDRELGENGELIRAFRREGDTLQGRMAELADLLEERGVDFNERFGDVIDDFFVTDRDYVGEAVAIVRGQVNDYFAALNDEMTGSVQGPLQIFDEIVPAVSPIVQQFETLRAQVESTRPDLEALNEDFARLGEELLDVDGLIGGAVNTARESAQDQFLAGLGIAISSDGGIEEASVDFNAINTLAEAIASLDMNAAELFGTDERGLMPEVQAAINETLQEGIEAILAGAENSATTLEQIQDIFGDRLGDLTFAVGDAADAIAQISMDAQSAFLEGIGAMFDGETLITGIDFGAINAAFEGIQALDAEAADLFAGDEGRLGSVQDELDRQLTNTLNDILANADDFDSTMAGIVAVFGDRLDDLSFAVGDAADTISDLTAQAQGDFLQGIGAMFTEAGDLLTDIDFGAINAAFDSITGLDSEAADLFEGSDQLEAVQGELDRQLTNTLNGILSNALDFDDTLAAIAAVFGDRINDLDFASNEIGLSTQEQNAEFAALQLEIARQQIEARELEIEAIEDFIDQLEDESRQLQGVADQAGRNVDALLNAANSLALDQQSSFASPLERLQGAQTRFEEAVAAANGDPADEATQEAIQDLPNLSREYQDAAASYYGNSEDFYDVQSSIQEELRSIASDQRTIEQQALDRLGDINSEIASQTELLAQLVEQQSLPEFVRGGDGQAIATGINGLPAGFDLGMNAEDNARIFRALQGIGVSISGFGEGQLGALRQSNPAVEALLQSMGFANGGAFANSVVMEPTFFDMGLMGEAGAEAIMPLTNVGGQLGVAAVVPANDGADRELLAENNALLRQILTVNQAHAADDRDANEVARSKADRSNRAVILERSA
jgi:tape measure domain-containing protein